MIKVGITGGESRRAGELIRLLVFHPDIELMWVHTASPMAAGCRLSALHRGLDGETAMNFTGGELRLSEIDVLFMCQDSNDAANLLASENLPDDLKIVSLCETMPSGFVYGLPELNRKAMVRGATRAHVPSAVAIAVATPLLPLAKNLLLEGPVNVTVERGTLDAALGQPDADEIALALRTLQTSFSGDITIEYADSPAQRGTTVTITTAIASPLATVTDLYTDFFDDHKLTYLLNRRAVADDVVNTAKCLISLDTDGGDLQITAVTDGLLKGAASTAVHCMNLLCGLYERTGLMLKCSAV